MRRPRDYSAEVTVGLIRIARTLSNIVSPPTMFALLGLALAWRDAPPRPALIWAAAFGFWVALAPIGFVVYLLRSGRISDLHMSTAGERDLPYLVSIAGAAIAYAVVRYLNGPSLLECLALLALLVLGLLALINRFWLISIHTTSIAAAAAVVGVAFGPRAAGWMLPLVGLVLWARLYLHRHTVGQALAGLFLGAGSVLSLSAAGCFS
ncbi:MAG: hypothetical protein ACRDHL_01970 [Candidatus Promineifilaceae bacterium]